MKVKTPYQLLLAGACAAISAQALAQVNFTIEGEIKDVTCTPTLTGSKYSGTTLKLDPVDLADLDTAGKTAGDTTINFAFNNCAMSTNNSNMWVHFTSATVDGAGRIIPSSGTGWVRFEVRDVTSGGTMGNLVQVGGTAGTQPTSGQGTAAPFTGSYPSRSVSKSYIVRYYAKAQVTQAGDLTAQMTYTVRYH